VCDGERRAGRCRRDRPAGRRGPRERVREADADGDGTLDANERTVFADLLARELEDLNPDVIESDGSGGTDLYWHHAPPTAAPTVDR
jgi:hypothetical protein